MGEGDRTVYAAPERHMCEVWLATGPIGSMWRCGTCGHVWKHHSVGLMRAGGWYLLGPLELWRWKRQQRKRG